MVCGGGVWWWCVVVVCSGVEFLFLFSFFLSSWCFPTPCFLFLNRNDLTNLTLDSELYDFLIYCEFLGIFFRIREEKGKGERRGEGRREKQSGGFYTDE